MGKTVISLLSNVIILGANILTGILVARMLGPENRGLLATAVSMALLIANSTSWSMNDLLARHLSKTRSNVLNVTGPHVALIAMGTVVGLVLLAVISTVPLILLPDAAVVILGGLFLIVPFIHLTLTLIGVLQSSERWIGWNIARIAPHVFYLLFLLLLPGAPSMGAIGQAFMLSYVVTCLIAVLAVRGLPVKRRGTSLPEIIKTAQASSNMHASRILQMTRQHLDRILIPSVFSGATLGYYVAAMALAMPIYAAATTITSIYIPRIARETLSEPCRRRRTFFELITLILFGLVACRAYVEFAPSLVTLFFGDSFAPAQLMLPATVSIIAGYSTSKLLEAYMIALNHTRVLILAETLPVISVLSGLYLFSGNFDMFLRFIGAVAWLVVLLYAIFIGVALRKEIFGPTDQPPSPPAG